VFGSPVTVLQKDQRVTLFQSNLHLFVAGNLPSKCCFAPGEITQNV